MEEQDLHSTSATATVLMPLSGPDGQRGLLKQLLSGREGRGVKEVVVASDGPGQMYQG